MPIIRPTKPTTSKALYEATVSLNSKLQKNAARAELREQAAEEKARKEAMAIYEASHIRSTIQHRYANFSESVKIKLLNKAVCDIATEAMTKVNESFGYEFFNIDDVTNLNAISFSFIRENGDASSLIYNMKKGYTTQFLSELASTIKSTHRLILETIDSMDPNTYSFGPQVMDKYSDDVKGSFGREDLIDSIATRVADAIKDFMVKNAEDKEKIIAAMTATKQKVDAMRDAPDAVKESYKNIGRRYITDIRERGPKSLFGEMVMTMSRSVVKTENAAIHEKFMDGAHLNMESIIKSVSTMYTFLETVNSMRLVKVDDAFVHELLESMAE